MIMEIWGNKMNIEIAEPGRMTQSGSSLLRIIQNNSMPVLDLLVRESVQNSLDAENRIGDYVFVEFNTGKFNSRELSSELEGITEGLNKKFSNKDYEYIAIGDSNTVGLTGKLHHEEVTENDYGNLLKLIYDICKPQNAEGAGGSWGLGKTVYFRIGIGLVIYYSRIKNDKGHYESRLAASLVEDEFDRNSLLNGKSKTGIAWWGDKIGQNKTVPVRNEKYIKKFLEVFQIEPYKDDKIGTVIIIPYIDSNKLLSNNKTEYLDMPYWYNSLEDYLSIAVQRWYVPRINNNNYPHGKWLRVKVNDKCITYDSMEPVFKIIQGLYNRAVTKKTGFNDILSNHIIKLVPINVRNVLQSSEAGFLAFTKIDRNMLKMNPPYNKSNPFMYLNCGITDTEKNRPIITFTRKPGMIVSYETIGPWTEGIDATEKQEFIIGLFVLNSGNHLSGEKLSLEEYIRKSEMADHNTWLDYTYKTMNPRIISRIQKNVINKVSKEFSAKDDVEEARLSSGLGKLYGDLLLPPENFGRKPSGTQIKENDKQKKTTVENYRDIILILDENKVEYNIHGIEIPLLVKTKKEVQLATVNIGIEAEAGIISAREWENELGMNLPFNIDEVAVLCISYYNGENHYPDKFAIRRTLPERKINNLKITLLKSDKGNYYGFTIMSEHKHNYELMLKIKLHLRKKNIRTVLNIETNEGDN